MLTDSEKKWLKYRKPGLCSRCAVYDDCPMIHSEDFIVSTCYRFRHEDYSIEKGNFEDVAEFEARVAAKLAMEFCPNYCDNLDANDCAISDCALYTKRKACCLKHARLAVEAEMEQGDKK